MKKEIEDLLNQLKNNNEKITKKIVAEKLNKHINTIYKNWEDSFDEYLNESIPLDLIPALNKKIKDLQSENSHLKTQLAALASKKNNQPIISTVKSSPIKDLDDSWLHFQKRK